MKTKEILLLTLIVFTVVITSCSKETEYTCECDGSAAGLTNQTYTIKEKSESDAKTTCDGYAENTGGLVVCKLK